MITRLKNQRGFSLVELVVAITVMAIMTAAIVPLFVFVSQSFQANKARMTAANLAGNVMEEIRTLPFNEVGIDGGNPAGNLPAARTEIIDGITFTIQTRINWSDNPPSGSCTGSGLPEYKLVRVTVTAPGLFSNGVTVSADLQTLVSRESEQSALTGGNIRACVFRGWRISGDDEVPVENVRVDLTSGPSAPQTVWTTRNGSALFMNLTAGEYTVHVDAGDLGMIVRPDQLPFTRTVAGGAWVSERFFVEYPSKLKIRFRTAEGNPLTGINGSLTLNQPYGDPLTGIFEASDIDEGGNLPASFLPGLWPVGAGYTGQYSIAANIPGYVLTSDDGSGGKWGIWDEDNNRQWDGMFTGPGTTITLTLVIEPITGSGILYEEQFREDFNRGTLTGVVATDRDTLELADGRDFRISPAYAAELSSERNQYRGYRFRVSQAVIVTHLIGGGSSGGFAVGLYRADGNRPAELLGAVQFTSGGRQQMVALDPPLATPVVLAPGQDYIIAQGRVTGSGRHYRVNSINVTSLLNSEEYLTAWFPNGNAIAWNVTGGPEVLENRSPSGTNNTTRPDIGFGYRPLTGWRISPPIELDFNYAPTFKIRWVAVVPAETSLHVLTAVSDSLTVPDEGAFLPVNNDSVIPGITVGEDLTGKYLWILEILGADDPSRTPGLDHLWVEYEF